MWETVFSGATAVGTIGAVVVALGLGLRQRSVDQQTLYDSRRPVLVPTLELTDKLLSVTAPHQISSIKLAIRNIGSGPASRVRGIAFIWYDHTDPANYGFTCLRANVHVPIAQQDKLGVVPLTDEKTKPRPEARIGETLGPSSAVKRLWANITDSQQQHPQPITLAPDRGTSAFTDSGIWRVTLSCHDLFGRKHASVFDFAIFDRQLRTVEEVAVFQGIQKDLDDLIHEAVSK